MSVENSACARLHDSTDENFDSKQIQYHGTRGQLQLVREIQSLQQQWDLLNKKLTQLRNQQIIETRAEEKFRLGQLIEEAEAECERISHRIEVLEPLIDAESVGINGDKPILFCEEGRRFACLIGTSEYNDTRTFPNLCCPQSNVEKLAQLLENKRLGYFDKVITLKNKPVIESIREIKQLSKKLKQDDLLLIYFSGYAILDENETNHIFLATRETAADELSSSALPLERIKTFLNECNAVRKILILDCLFRNDAQTVKQQLGSNTDGIYVLSNSPESGWGTLSGDAQTLSPLTGHLIEGLESGRADTDNSGRITTEECYAYLQRQMTQQGLAAPLKWEDVAGRWVISQAPCSNDEPGIVLAPSIKRYYKHINEMFQEGLVIPFLGSGAVLEQALTEQDEECPPWISDMLPLERDLVQRMTRITDFTQMGRQGSLPFLAQYCQSQMTGGRPHFYKKIKEFFPDNARPGSVHRFLVQQEKPMLVVTTWYDNLLEEVFREHGKKFAVVTHVAYDAKEEDLGKVLVQYSDQPDEVRIELSDELRIDLETYWVFYKIQGSFNLFRKGLGGREEIDSIVISEEDYVSFVSRVSDQHRTIPALFNLPFQQRMFLFLGCRMNDWNFRTLLHIFWREKRMQKEGGFTVRKEITEFEKKYWESKGIQIIDNTVAEFMDGLARELGIIL